MTKVTSTLFGEGFSDALFSADGKHRFWLIRVWENTLPMVMFIGLNPSTANGFVDDPTIRKLRKIAMFNGFGGFYMMNLFTFISTDPKKLNIQDGNTITANAHLLEIGERCQCIVFAWGNFETFGRAEEVKKMFPEACALHINKNDSPKHPLYCLDKTHFVNYQ